MIILCTLVRTVFWSMVVVAKQGNKPELIHLIMCKQMTNCITINSLLSCRCLGNKTVHVESLNLSEWTIFSISLPPRTRLLSGGQFAWGLTQLAKEKAPSTAPMAARLRKAALPLVSSLLLPKSRADFRHTSRLQGSRCRSGTQTLPHDLWAKVRTGWRLGTSVRTSRSTSRRRQP